MLAQGVSTHKAKPVARLAPSGRPFDAHFVDVAAAAGLREPTIYGGVDSKKYILESTGCGCAFIDYDNDGWMDIFLLCGTRLEGAPPGATNRLYKNNRDGTFTDVTEKAGLHAVGWACGVCVGDYNNDGFDDIFCTYFGQNILYRNNGDGTFTDVTKAAGLLNDQPRWGAGCSFLDYNRDGHLDLVCLQLRPLLFEHAPVPGENTNCNWKGIPVECGPRGLPTGRHSLYRNNGDGTFTDVSEQAGIAQTSQSYGMTVVAADLDEDGWPDIYVACDSTPSLLFMNNHDGTFREEGVMRGVALSDDGEEQAGMGVGVGDYDLDGHLDLFKTHFADDANVLYHNDGKGNFDDVTRNPASASRRGISAGERKSSIWTMMVIPTFSWSRETCTRKSNVSFPQYPNKTPRAVFRNLGNRHLRGACRRRRSWRCEASLQPRLRFRRFRQRWRPRHLDRQFERAAVAVAQRSARQPELDESKAGRGRSPIAAPLEPEFWSIMAGKRRRRAVFSQSSFYSCNDPRLHFGLASYTTVDLEFHWPSGLVESFKHLAVNQLITFKEGVGPIPNRGWSKR